MRFSLAPSVICAAVAVVIPFARAQGTLPDGIYRLESTAFDAPVLVLDLSAFTPIPDTPILIFQNNGGQNQQWNVTTSGSGYTLTAVSPGSHAFIDVVGAGSLVTGTPDNATTFLFNKVGADTYQIEAASDDGAFALEAPASVGQVTLSTLDATDPHQIWRLVPV